MKDRDRYDDSDRDVHFEEAEVMIGCDGYYLSLLNKVVQPPHSIHKGQIGGLGCSIGGRERYLSQGYALE